jgi:hypothetical protein
MRILLSVLLLSWSLLSAAQDYSGNLAVEGITFPKTAKFPEQLSDDLSLSFKPRVVGD